MSTPTHESSSSEYGLSSLIRDEHTTIITQESTRANFEEAQGRAGDEVARQVVLARISLSSVLH